MSETIRDLRDKEDKTPIGQAVDLLFSKRAQLLEGYEGLVISLSFDFNKDNQSALYREMEKINDQIKFVTRILSLTRDQTRFATGDIPPEGEER